MTYLKPKFGRRVRDAHGKLFPAEGRSAVLTPHLRRLIADGDLVAVDPPAPAPEKTTAPRRKSANRKTPSKKGTAQ